MRQTILALSAAVAALALAPSANASVTVTCPQIAGLAVCTFDNVNNTGVFGDSLIGAVSFDDTFKIILSTVGTLSITLTNTVGPISFTTQALTGQGNVAGGAVANNFNVGAGTYDLHFVGSTAGTSSYSGTIDFTAVPELATWGMMLAGFGLVGGAMRMRRQAIRFA